MPCQAGAAPAVQDTIGFGVKITISKENYLKAIAEAESEGEPVIAATLARWLNGSVGESILHEPPCSVLVAVKSEHRASNVTPIQQLKVLGKR